MQSAQLRPTERGNAVTGHRTLAQLPRPARKQNRRDRENENLDIQEHVPRHHVVAIEKHPRRVASVATSADLPEARHTGTHAQLVTARAAIFAHLLVNDGTRPDEAHLADKHIDQLRKFIEAELAQDSPQRRDPRVVMQLSLFFPDSALFGETPEMLFQDPVAIDDHRPEFPAPKLLAAPTDADVSEKHGPRTRHTDKRGNPEQKRNKQRQENEHKQQVEPTLGNISCRTLNERFSRSSTMDCSRSKEVPLTRFKGHVFTPQ